MTAITAEEQVNQSHFNLAAAIFWNRTAMLLENDRESKDVWRRDKPSDWKPQLASELEVH